MAKENWHILSFSEGKPVWFLYDGEKLAPEAEPGAKRTGTTIALIPDDFLFFVMVAAPRSLRERNIHSGLRLRMRHSFPQPAPRQERSIFRVSPDEVLGYDSHPGLPDFLDRHRELLDSADVVTSPFILSFMAAKSENLSSWVWSGNGGPSALVHEHELQYFRSGRDELENRLSLLRLEQSPAVLDLERSLKILSGRNVRPSRLRLPLNMLRSARDFEPRFWTRVIVATAVAGLLFCAGQAAKLVNLHKTVATYELANDSLYKSVLGPDPGSDPFGMLLYKLEERRGGSRSGADILGMLSLLSGNAPEQLKIENISYSNEAGSLRAIIGTFDQLEAMLANLSKAKEYGFTLEQASNTADGVLFNMKFVTNRQQP